MNTLIIVLLKFSRKSSQMDFEHGSDAQNESADFTNINTVRQLEQVHSEPVTCVVHVDSGVCLSGSKDQVNFAFFVMFPICCN